MNKFMLSSIVSACLEYSREGGPGLVELEKYLTLVHDKYHHLLLTVCAKKLSEIYLKCMSRG